AEEAQRVRPVGPRPRRRAGGPAADDRPPPRRSAEFILLYRNILKSWRCPGGSPPSSGRRVPGAVVGQEGGVEPEGAAQVGEVAGRGDARPLGQGELASPEQLGAEARGVEPAAGEALVEVAQVAAPEPLVAAPLGREPLAVPRARQERVAREEL